MQLKTNVFKAIKPMSGSFAAFKWLAIVQACVTAALPFVWSDVATAYWLLSLALLGFWLSNYIVLKMAYVHKPPQKGLRGWLSSMTENIIFLVWLGVFLAVLLLVFKVVMLF